MGGWGRYIAPMTEEKKIALKKKAITSYAGGGKGSSRIKKATQ